MVKYFSAFAHHIGHDAVVRHKEYINALEHVGVSVILGRFKKTRRRCRTCKEMFYPMEEKETDVNVAVHLVSDALMNRFDRAILLTADTDYVAALELARKETRKIIDVAAPPKRMGRARDLNPLFEVTPGRIDKSRFPNEVIDSDGNLIATAPLSYQ